MKLCFPGYVHGWLPGEADPDSTKHPLLLPAVASKGFSDLFYFFVFDARNSPLAKCPYV